MIIESGLSLSPTDVDGMYRLSFAELVAWERGAAKRAKLQIALNGDLIATVMNMLSTGTTLYTRDDIYPSQQQQQQNGADFERILRDRFGDAGGRRW